MKSILFKFLMVATCLVTNPLHGMDKPTIEFEGKEGAPGAVLITFPSNPNTTLKLNVPPGLGYHDKYYIEDTLSNLNLGSPQKRAAQLKLIVEAINPHNQVLLSPGSLTTNDNSIYAYGTKEWRELNQRAWIFDACASVDDPARLQALTEATAMLVTPTMTSYFRKKVFEALKSIKDITTLKPLCEAIQTQAETFFPTDTSGSSIFRSISRRTEILGSLLQGDSDKITALGEVLRTYNATIFTQPLDRRISCAMMGLKDSAEIKSTCEAIHVLAPALFPPNCQGGDRTSTLVALIESDQARRDAVGKTLNDHLNKYFTSDTKSWLRDSTIRSLFEIKHSSVMLEICETAVRTYEDTFRSSVVNDDEALQIISALIQLKTKTSIEEVGRAIRPHLNKLFQKDMTGDHKAWIINRCSDESPAYVETVANILTTDLIANKPVGVKLDILDALANLKFDQLSYGLELLQALNGTLFTSKMSGEDIEKIIHSFGKIEDPTRILSVGRVIVRLLTPDMTVDEKVKMIGALAELPDPATMNDVAWTALLCATQDMTGEERAEILQTIAGVKDREKITTLCTTMGTYAEKIFTNNMSAENRSAILASLGEIDDAALILPTAELAAAVMTTALPNIKLPAAVNKADTSDGSSSESDDEEDLSDETRVELVERFAGIKNPSKIKGMCDVARTHGSKLFTPTMKATTKAGILIGFGMLNDAVLMLEVAEVVTSLFTENMSLKDREKILASITDIEEDKLTKIWKVCEAIHTHGSVLFAPNMSGKEKARIIGALEIGCASEMILEVSHRACLLITPDMKAENRIDIIQGVKSLLTKAENDDRWKSIEALLTKLSPRMPGDDKAEIIEAIFNLRDLGEHKIVKKTLTSKLISPNFSGPVLAKIISAAQSFRSPLHVTEILEAIESCEGIFLSSSRSEDIRGRRLAALIQFQDATRIRALAEALQMASDILSYPREDNKSGDSCIIDQFRRIKDTQKFKTVAQAASMTFTPEMSGSIRAEILCLFGKLDPLMMLTKATAIQAHSSAFFGPAVKEEKKEWIIHCLVKEEDPSQIKVMAEAIQAHPFIAPAPTLQGKSLQTTTPIHLMDGDIVLDLLRNVTAENMWQVTQTAAKIFRAGLFCQHPRLLISLLTELSGKQELKEDADIPTLLTIFLKEFSQKGPLSPIQFIMDVSKGYLSKNPSLKGSDLENTLNTIERNKRSRRY